MTKNQKKLETLLMQCIEDQMKDPCRERLNLVPDLANELISLWVNAGEGDASPDFEAEEEMSAETPENNIIEIQIVLTGVDEAEKQIERIIKKLEKANALADASVFV